MSKHEAYIFVQKDGVPLHRHPGHPKLHGPWLEHDNASLHSHPLLKADYAKLTKAQQADYDSGEDLSKRWLDRYKTDEHKATGYKPRPGGRKVAAVSAVKEAQAIAAEAFEDAQAAAQGFISA